MSELAVFDGLPPLEGAARVKFLESMLKTKIQDNDGSDTGVIIYCAIILFLTGVFLSFVWVNRKYRPLRAKTIKLCTLMYLATIPWALGDFQMNGLVSIKGGWAHCRFWVVWMRILFSFLYSTLVTLRFYALDRIFIQGKPYKGRALYVPAVSLFIVLLGYCLTCQFINVYHISYYFKYASICVVDDRYRYVSVGLIWIPWCGVLFFAFRIRSIQSSFNELYESLFTCVLGFLILIKTTVVHATHPYYLFAKGFRHSETIIDVTATNLIIWIMLGYPAYQCLFNRENYDREWAKKLRTDGYASKYSAEFDSTPNETTSYSRMNDSMFEHNKMGTKDFYDKDPLDTIRMLSANGGGTLTSNTIPSPNSVYRPPLSNLDFGSMNDGSLDSFDNSMDGRTDFRRII
ncbi:hypothetical protein LPJ57_002204 [Coemansia sp. RSA 486]|nr:hypothetical protein LPJ57_002204 [Coemansia sp. RSA 486]KAJ2234800.1 hypothetical protein IWW45_003114 [Coemansia sp. RSA 485]KAJ2602101.1 hypothetical protein GGF39_000930 [Coemansia sp. RSA 1721]